MAKKDKLIKDFVEIRKKIINLVSSLPSEQLDKVFLGVWSVKDLLAHLIGWDYWNLRGAKEILAGKLPSFYSYYGPDWANFNAMLVKKYKKENFKQLISSLKKSHQELMSFLRTIPVRELDKERGLRWGGYKITVRGEIQPEIDDEKIHCQQIYDWKSNKPFAKIKKNSLMEKLLRELKKLNLPKDKFAVYGSGPLGVRGIRKIKDLDLIVTSDLWKKLAKKYLTKDLGDKLRIDFGRIEILAKPIVYKAERLIREADIIDSIRYVRLETLMELKKKMGREKDLKDIKLIKDYLKKGGK